jgi:hypothetical protein
MKRNTITAGLVTLLVACSNVGSGDATFTTWGEEYVEQQIGPDPTGQDGFIDGWTLMYEKFLVTIRNIKIASHSGTVGASTMASYLVDNVLPGRKTLVTFADLNAQAWTAVGYQIAPATADTLLVGATAAADKTMMVTNGYSIFVQGRAFKVDEVGARIEKTFRWGFKTATQYSACKQAPESGREIEGIVVTNGGNDISELTTHGDHFFYDRLQASADPAVPTRLRFDEKAKADANADGEITMDELAATPIDVRNYDPSPFEVVNLGAFVTALTRTVGHFRGEGECQVAPL